MKLTDRGMKWESQGPASGCSPDPVPPGHVPPIAEAGCPCCCDPFAPGNVTVTIEGVGPEPLTGAWAWAARVSVILGAAYFWVELLKLGQWAGQWVWP